MKQLITPLPVPLPLLLLLLLALAAPAVAQEREIRSANLPSELEWELLHMFEGAAERYEGAATVERGQVVRGDVAALGGPLTVAGRILGDLAMLNGDVIVEPEGSVSGDITVIGGEVRLGDGASVGGTITAYAGSDRHRTRDRDRDRDRDSDWDRWWERRRDDRREHGYSRLTLRTGSSYNRVEGLPVMFGPVIRTSRPNPFRFEALGIWRSESGASLDTDRMGYQVKAEQFVAGERLSVGASLYSVVDPLDRWQISDAEASLAALLFHDDYRDYYDRTGWSAFVRGEPVRGLEAQVEYRQEEHRAVAAGDPWSLFHGGDTWRNQPLVADGDLRLLAGSLELDLRDHEDDPREGWYGRIAVERPVEGELERLQMFSAFSSHSPPNQSLFVPAGEYSTDFWSGHLDLRRYSRVGWDSQLNVRLVAGGSMTGQPLPPQFQHALGGIGTLPGFGTFHGDCGARTSFGVRDGAAYFPSYGCDRFALAQVEYRGELSLGFGFGDPDYQDDDWWDIVDIDLSPTWVVFFDAGQGWAYEQPGVRPAMDTGALLDAGVGFLIDDLGIYAALPLNGEVDQEPRFFVRLGRRF